MFVFQNRFIFLQDKEGKKSPVRKSSSDMGPPLRRPPHTSTPSPQPVVSRTSPTMPTSITFVPATVLPMTSDPVEQNTAMEILKLGSSSDQHIQNVSIHFSVFSLATVPRL